MPASADSEFDPRLLDLHLGQLSSEERAALEQRIQGDPDLTMQNEALAAMFRALNSDRQSQPEPPIGLAETISARVAAAGAPPRVIRPARKTAAQLAEQFNDRAIIRLHSFREIAAVAAVIVLAIGLGVPSMLQMRQRGQRILCSEHLASIGRGMQSYALANNNALPFAGWNAGANTWRPTDQPNLRVLPNRQHAYCLVRNAYVPARIFICPSTPALPMPDAQAANYDDFLEASNVSYAYQNMAGVRPSLSDNPDLPVFGDDNPLFDNGFPLLELMRSLGLTDPTRANSRAHDGAGQNILTIRGTVKWFKTPIAGVKGDNIWTLQGVDEYTGREGPQTTTDSHLLK